MTQRETRSDWQLPAGVTQGSWQYSQADFIAEDYDAYFAEHGLLKFDQAVLDQWFTRPGTVIDYGCGTGRALLPLVAPPESDLTMLPIDIELDEDLCRRFKAKAAFEGTTMGTWLYELVAQWTGNWPNNVLTYIVRYGDTLSALARRYYNNARKYWVIAHFNGIANPSLIRVGMRLSIPEPILPVPVPAGESRYLDGIHDPGGEALMGDSGRKGWVLVTEEVGRDPHDTSGKDYRYLQDAG